MNATITHFNLRIYGLFVNDRKEVLLSDEYQLDMKMTKFPGGGLKPGEGPVDCLKREIREEMNQEICNIRHFYTTDFFQRGFFTGSGQVISIYYTASFDGKIRFRVSDKPFDFPDLKNGNMSFRWKKIAELRDEDLTFPIDRYVGRMLKALI